MYSYEKTTLISCRNIEVVFSYVFSFYVFVCPYLQLYEADLKASSQIHHHSDELQDILFNL